MLETLHLAGVIAVLLYCWWQEVNATKRRMGLRNDSRTRLKEMSTVLVEGLLLDVEHEIGEPVDPEEPRYRDRYLVYSYEVEVDGELKEFRGSHFVEDEVIFRPNFSLEFGRPVRVRYGLYEPETSCLEDY